LVVLSIVLKLPRGGRMGDGLCPRPEAEGPRLSRFAGYTVLSAKYLANRLAAAVVRGKLVAL